MAGNGSVLIGLAGDVMIGRGVDQAIAREGFDYPWGDLLPLLRNTDLNIANLEAALTRNDEKVDKVFNFKSDPKNVRVLTDANIRIVNLANNHVLDYSEEGLVETLHTLDAAGIVHTGAGRNDLQAAQPVIYTVKDMRIGVLGFTDNERRWRAGMHKSGINFLDVYNRKEIRSALAAISRLREEVDLLVVSIHWGPNMREEPPAPFVQFAHEMVQVGVDVVHGHSAHIFQGIECYRNAAILYDTGDFVDDYVVDPVLRNDLSFFYLLKVCPKGVEDLKLNPVAISHYRVNHARGSDYEWCIKRIQQLSRPFGTDISDDGEIRFRMVLEG